MVLDGLLPHILTLIGAAVEHTAARLVARALDTGPYAAVVCSANAKNCKPNAGGDNPLEANPAQLKSLISSQTHSEQFGFLGSKYIVVLNLNEALAKMK